MPNTCQLIMDSCGVMEFIRRDYERLWGKYKRLFKRSSYDECTVRVLSEMVEVEDGDSDGIDDLSSATEDPTDPLTPCDVWRLVVTKSFDELWLDSHAKVLFNLQQCQPAPQDNKQEQDHEAGRTLEDDTIDRSLRDDMSDTSNPDVATGSEHHDEGDAFDGAGDDGGGVVTGGDDESTEGKAAVTTTLSALLHPGLVHYQSYIVDLLEKAQ